MAGCEVLEQAALMGVQQQGVEEIDGHREEHGRYRITLTQAAGGGYRGARGSVDEDPRACGGEENGDPFDPAPIEAQVTKDVDDEGPGDRVKSARDVKLEEDARHAEVVELAGGLLDQHKIVVHTPPGDECTLVGGDELAQARSEAQGEDFCNALRDQVD